MTHRILLFGRPVGTIASKVSSQWQIPILSTGDELRYQVRLQSELGQRVKATMDSGRLVSDDLICQMMIKRLTGSESYLLDGFPRNLTQACVLDNQVKQGCIAALNLIVHLDVPRQIIVSRLKDRWIHPASGRVYNTSWNRPRQAGLDDLTGEKLVRRVEDDEATVLKRLDVYDTETQPLLQYYQNHHPSLLHTLQGESTDQLWPKFQQLISAFS